MTITLTHLVDVATDGLSHRPTCSCGWSGDPSDEDTALLAGVEHRDGEVGPGDEVDRCISGLLDLQDDIAQAVIWLAENWSTDLPEPGWYAGSSDRHSDPVVTILVPCIDADEMTRSVAALGADPVDEATPNRYGDRYRHAYRYFGRVVVAASLAIERGRS